jgi:hypothetical protein
MSSKLPHGVGRLQVFPSMPPQPDREAWCAWLRRHGIDPDRVAIPGWIACDDSSYRIYVDVYVLNERGARFVDSGDDFVRAVLTVQLEGPALPFPDQRCQCTECQEYRAER